MKQIAIASLLAVATDWLMEFIYSQRGGAYMRDKTTYYMQELELKVQGGLRTRGGGGGGPGV